MVSKFFILLVFSISFVMPDEIDVSLNEGNVIKLLKAMSNETKGADSLNLPANASSIRENITDTFSCENRTYGYYADVDNECQVFHVCLPSQTSSGRNVTYKWSFICPNETIFNQEVLVCTRLRDAIPCEESPMYYDVNNEFGKIPNDTMKDGVNNTIKTEPSRIIAREKDQKRRPLRKKQNIVVQNLLEDVAMHEMEKIEDAVPDNGEVEIVPVLVDIENDKNEFNDDVEMEIKDGGRFVEERSMHWKERDGRRGGFRFKADV